LQSNLKDGIMLGTTWRGAITSPIDCHFTTHKSKESQSGTVTNLCSVCIRTYMCTAGGMDYQSEIYSVTVEAEETSAEVSIAIFNDTIF